MASFAACDLIDGDFSLWFDWWRLLPMVYKWQLLPVVWLRCFILRNDDFCLWFDWWRLLTACDLIDGVFCLWFDLWRLLPVVWLNGNLCQNDWLMGFWLMCFILRNGDFCLWFDWRWLISVVWLMYFIPQRWRLLPNCWLNELCPTISAKLMINGLLSPTVVWLLGWFFIQWLN